MESRAKGCEVVVSGKLRGQRAKSMKFVDGLMIHSGEPCMDYVDTATRHVLLRQGKPLVPEVVFTFNRWSEIAVIFYRPNLLFIVYAF